MIESYKIEMSIEKRKDLVYRVLEHAGKVIVWSDAKRRDMLELIKTIVLSTGNTTNGYYKNGCHATFSDSAGPLIQRLIEEDQALYCELEPFFTSTSKKFYKKQLQLKAKS